MTKKHLFSIVTLGMLMCIFAVSILCGCSDKKKNGKLLVDGPEIRIQTIKHQGHNYLHFRTPWEQIGILHDPDCLCHKATLKSEAD